MIELFQQYYHRELKLGLTNFSRKNLNKMTDEVKKWLDKQPKIIADIESLIKEQVFKTYNHHFDELFKKQARERDKSLRFFFLMMFRLPAMCCTNGDFVRVVKEHCTEYRYNGIPFARESFEEVPLRYGEIRYGPRMGYVLRSTLPLKKQAEFFCNIPIKEFHWNGKIFAKY